MAQIQVGDIVRFLSSKGGGRVIKIEGNLAHVEEDDGFETPVLARDLVVVAHAGDDAGGGITRDAFGGYVSKKGANPPKKSSPTDSNAPKPTLTAADVMEEVAAKTEGRVEPADEPVAIIETPQGEKINLLLAFEADDIKHLSDTTYFCSLVNDSNFYISFSLLSRRSDDEQWTLLQAATVEPNIQLLVDELTPQQVPALEQLAFQFMAYKKGKPFALKPAATVETRLDVTKFFKLHCFHPNPYFDVPVIAVPLVRDDQPVGAQPLAPEVPEAAPKPSLPEPKPRRRQVVRRQPAATALPGQTDAEGKLIVDLHIGELLETTAGMDSAEILNYQVDTFCRTMDANLSSKGKKIVFIHGKGEGVLRHALMKELSHRYKSCDVQDASFREYGFGATQVTIR